MAKKAKALMVDSGASFHTIDPKDLTASERSHITTREIPICLDTATGPIEVTQSVEIFYEPLNEWLDCLILEDSPGLLSLGKLVGERFYGYLGTRS